jgi:hypothetical protein
MFGMDSLPHSLKRSDPQWSILLLYRFPPMSRFRRRKGSSQDPPWESSNCGKCAREICLNGKFV